MHKTKAEIKQLKDVCLKGLEDMGYTLEDFFELFEEEACDYASDHGYGYCDQCDDRRRDPN